MIMVRFLLVCLLLAALPFPATTGRAMASPVAACAVPRSGIEEKLDQALRARDLTRVQALVATVNDGSRAPVPEKSERYAVLPQRVLDTVQLRQAHENFIINAGKMSWWNSARPPAPGDTPAPLRAPARLARSLVAVAAIDADARLLKLARAAGDYLIRASTESGFEGAPFPNWRGRGGRLGGLVDRAVRRLEECGGLSKALRSGWLVLEQAPWEHYFDTGLAGEALARLYRGTREPRYLEAALRAGVWAHRQPISTNWNYNAFVAGFFVELHVATDDPVWIDRALERVRFGVLPGMIAKGVHAGHFVDPHNERIAYRVIMARSLSQLAGVLARARHSALKDVESAAQIMIGALERQMRSGGGVTSPAAMAELYAEIDTARAMGAHLSSTDSDLRRRILHALVDASSRNRVTPDSGVGDALVLLRKGL
jgi:hypothetical protein